MGMTRLNALQYPTGAAPRACASARHTVPAAHRDAGRLLVFRGRYLSGVTWLTRQLDQTHPRAGLRDTAARAIVCDQLERSHAKPERGHGPCHRPHVNAVRTPVHGRPRDYRLV